MAAPIISDLYQAVFDLDVANAVSETVHEVSVRVTQHIERWSDLTPVFSPQFEPDLQWFNTYKPLTLSGDLGGKMVVLHFFTHGCVNCQHITPDLTELQKIYSIEDGVVVIGVHSPKFDHEKRSSSLRHAILRQDVTYPVMNDPDCGLWHALSITCWPTLLVLGPEGQVIFLFVGEGHRRHLFLGMRLCLGHFASRISNHGLPIRLEKHLIKPTFLSYPGKVSCSSDGLCLAIADTANHRIVVTSNVGVVMDIIGSGQKGFRDGDCREAAFSSPQGVCFAKNSVIYVADSDNHAIRKIDMFRGTVVTLAGNGTVGKDEEGGAKGYHQLLNTPWDICLVNSQTSSSTNPDVLLIAMAGFHQIWLLAVEDGTHWYNCDPQLADSVGTCLRIYGSGKEEHRNHRDPLKAGFAQPSGITYDPDAMQVYVADCESSSIRKISLLEGSVKTIVGGSRDPSDLFCFGDVDCVEAGEVKFQHPLGIVYSHRLGKILVADTYNHKIKFIDPLVPSCLTLIGDGQCGDTDGLGITTRLNEPGGICLAETPSDSILYIADTNNHCIKAVDLATNISRKIRVLYRPDLLARNPVSSAVLPITANNTNSVAIVSHLPVYYDHEEPVTFKLSVAHIKLIKADFPVEWAVSVNIDGVMEHLELTDHEQKPVRGSWGQMQQLIVPAFLQVKVKSTLPDSRSKFLLTIDVYAVFYDAKNVACIPKQVRFTVPFRLLRVYMNRVTIGIVDLFFVHGG